MTRDARSREGGKSIELVFRFLFAKLLATALSATLALAQSPLENCADQFIDSLPSNAPTIGHSAPEAPFATNRHLCYRTADSNFFALEYWPEQFAPRWAAYRLDPANYGPDGCRTYTRARGNCYINAPSWDEFSTCAKKYQDDRFYADHMLASPKLAGGDFLNSGHDRGHIAPRQSLSWHVCGAYQSFTMANMSPQRALLNQKIWANLEAQVLTWAVDEGPLYVITGTVFRRFPHERFEIYTNGTFDAAHIYPPGITMLETVTQHQINFATHPENHILKPERDADPAKIASKVRNLRMPTGYYKIAFRQGAGDAPPHAIGFLIPHTFENLNEITGVPGHQAFWAFVARIDLIEQVSGTRFPGIPENMKPVWGDSFFLSRRTGRDIRSKTCDLGAPGGVIEHSTNKERRAACIPGLE